MTATRSFLAQAMLNHLPADGSTIGNGKLRQQLEADGIPVDEASYEASKAKLIDAGLAQPGRGRGGSLRRADPSAAAPASVQVSLFDAAEEAAPARGQAKLAKRDPALGDHQALLAKAAAVEARLARHKALEDEAKAIKAALKATDKKQEELVTAAREKISRNEAKVVIIKRLHRELRVIYGSYLQANIRTCQDALTNLHDKYAVTAATISAQREAATKRLDHFLKELGYV